MVRHETIKRSQELENYISHIGDNSIRVPGTSVILTLDRKYVPLVLLENFKHNQILHEQIILVTVITENSPYVARKHRLELRAYEKGFYRLVVRYGFMQSHNIYLELL